MEGSNLKKKRQLKQHMKNIKVNLFANAVDMVSIEHNSDESFKRCTPNEEHVFNFKQLTQGDYQSKPENMI